jgi:cytochrome c
MRPRMLAAFFIGVMAVATGIAGRAVDTQPRTEPQEVKVQDVKVQDVTVLAEQSGCLKCHAVDKKVTGPAFRDIAARYKNDSRAREMLREKVKKGGKGNWAEETGGALMPPHSALLPEPLIAQLVDWVLSLKRE